MAGFETADPAKGVALGFNTGRSRKPWSIQRWLILVMLAALVTTAAAAGYGFAWTADQARDAAVDRMTFRADRAAASISRSVVLAESSTTAVAAQQNLAAVFEQPAGCLLTIDGTEAFPNARLDIVNPEGRVGCSSDPAAATSTAVHAGSDWLTQVSVSDTTVVVWTSVDAVTGQPALVVAAPFRTDGVYSGTVVLFLQLPGTADILATDLVAADSAAVTIVDRSSRKLVTTTGSDSELPDAGGVPDWPVRGEWTGVDGSVRFFGSSDVANSGWRVYVGAERSAVLAQARGALLRQLLIGALALLALAAAVWVLNRRVARPLKIVTDAVVNARAGLGPVRVAETGSAELQTLAREFNAMLDVRSGHEAQLAHQATHDPVTGLPNRVLLRDHLDRALGSHDATTSVAVLSCGLLRFKVVGDSLGHDVGDRLLAAAADRLQAVMRQDDTLARFGDDEFVVICRNTTIQGAIQIAERLHGSLAEPFRGIGESAVVLGAAVGIAVATETSLAGGQLLRESDTAMRHAKDIGDPWWVYEDHLHLLATQRLQDEEALRRALTGGELVVWYQPLHNVATGTLIGAEALVRWQHPVRGLVPPDEFIPLAEESGQIVALGQFVLGRACLEAAAWAAAGCAARVSVNVSVEQLHDAEFRGHVDRALAAAGLAPELLCLEITESSIMTEIGRVSGVLSELRELGVHIAIDDFGTGYSSLSYLPRLPVTELKIDRSFISRLGADSSERHLVKAIIAMAGALDLTVVAEGVESSVQLEALADLHCDLAQGYLLGRPMPAHHFLPHLLGQRGTQPAALTLTKTSSKT